MDGFHSESAVSVRIIHVSTITSSANTPSCAPLIAQRISLKLSALTAAADILYSTFQIYSLVITEPGFNCSFSVWGYVFFSLLSISFTVSIAYMQKCIESDLLTLVPRCCFIEPSLRAGTKIW
ncbi:hypothetical protein BC937DRAFT_94023 [Endogone sp. FLAS-F59071]|nr:hypothetical protein BC937DRAFT_94023 [Endogone sp. FLAS-F59071]|eukprot:RUS20926.1 hypothetical protein BC937DRAFT_94023 [Endogone sp. FLAS-F59071]